MLGNEDNIGTPCPCKSKGCKKVYIDPKSISRHIRDRQAFEKANPGKPQHHKGFKKAKHGGKRRGAKDDESVEDKVSLESINSVSSGELSNKSLKKGFPFLNMNKQKAIFNQSTDASEWDDARLADFDAKSRADISQWELNVRQNKPENIWNLEYWNLQVDQCSLVNSNYSSKN
jgi:hypothetical protein